jgi:hypothetical protein
VKVTKGLDGRTQKRAKVKSAAKVITGEVVSAAATSAGAASAPGVSIITGVVVQEEPGGCQVTDPWKRCSDAIHSALKLLQETPVGELLDGDANARRSVIKTCEEILVMAKAAA